MCPILGRKNTAANNYPEKPILLAIFPNDCPRLDQFNTRTNNNIIYVSNAIATDNNLVLTLHLDHGSLCVVKAVVFLKRIRHLDYAPINVSKGTFFFDSEYFKRY